MWRLLKKETQFIIIYHIPLIKTHLRWLFTRVISTFTMSCSGIHDTTIKNVMDYNDTELNLKKRKRNFKLQNLIVITGNAAEQAVRSLSHMCLFFPV
jgi:hypothetical protein